MEEREPPVVLAVAEDIAEIVLNRPAGLNVINVPMAEGLLDALREIASNDAVRAVVIRATGEAFMAGGDLSSFHRDLRAGRDSQIS